MLAVEGLVSEMCLESIAPAVLVQGELPPRIFPAFAKPPSSNPSSDQLRIFSGSSFQGLVLSSSFAVRSALISESLLELESPPQSQEPPQPTFLRASQAGDRQTGKGK